MNLSEIVLEDIKEKNGIIYVMHLELIVVFYIKNQLSLCMVSEVGYVIMWILFSLYPWLHKISVAAIKLLRLKSLTFWGSPQIYILS